MSDTLTRFLEHCTEPFSAMINNCLMKAMPCQGHAIPVRAQGDGDEGKSDCMCSTRFIPWCQQEVRDHLRIGYGGTHLLERVEEEEEEEDQGDWRSDLDDELTIDVWHTG